MRRRLAAASALALLCGTAAGAGTAGRAPDVTLHAVATGMGPVRQQAPMMLKVHLADARLRIDFDAPARAGGYLLADTGARQAWLVSEAGEVALPVPTPVWTDFRVDPAAPCAGMRARCEPGPADVVANRLVQTWRYRDADGRGPDGTDRGTLSVDPRTGLVMAFTGRLAGRAAVREFRVTAVDQAPLEKALFELPRTLEQVETRSRSRTRGGEPDRARRVP